MKKLLLFLFATILVFSLVGVSSATIMTYTNRALFEAALATFQEDTFNDVSTDTIIPRFPDPGTNYLDRGPYTWQELGNDLSNYNMIDVSPFVSPDHNVDGTPFLRAAVVLGSQATRLRATFDDPIFAFGFDYANLNDGGAGLDLLLGTATEQEGVDPDSELVSLLASLSEDGFFGVISTDNFTQVTFQARGDTGTGEGFGIDNVVYGPAASVPEPTTLLLLGTGLIGLAGLSRRKFFKK